MSSIEEFLDGKLPFKGNRLEGTSTLFSCITGETLGFFKLFEESWVVDVFEDGIAITYSLED